jgi:hypothetical protein
MWSHLPVQLHGALWEGDAWGSYSQWHWVFANGRHEMLRRSSSEWAWLAAAPMADVMQSWWSWWMLTDRDADFRAGNPVAPWKMGGDLWFSVGGP